MREKLKKISENKFLKNPFVANFIMAFLLNLLIETLARNTMPVYGGLYFLFTKPVVFLANTLIIYATLSVTTLFRRSLFVKVVITSVWVAIGVANGVILTQRMTPFTMKDLSSLADGVTIITNYFTTWQLVLIFGSAGILIVSYVVVFFKGKKREYDWSFRKRFACVILIMAVASGTVFGLTRAGVLNTFFGNLAYAYRDYGVPYCFINTWLNTGIHKPSDYSREKVLNLFEEDEFMSSDGTMKLPAETDRTVSGNMPNIIFLQLESFVDPTKFTNVELDRDPIPYFRSLMRNYSTGSLTVPACGAGTANTEFEVMTGISVKFFGPGEYPFKAVLKDRPAESLAFDLKSLGYGAHAIHNHRALFYNRNEVFDNIGYDTFTSVEYMHDVEKTPKNWEKDNILTSQITDALRSTESRDYIYTISVQGHGKYPADKVLANPAVRVTNDVPEETKNKYEYYIHQVYQMDEFVKDLTNTLSGWDEPVVLVMYGDHIPALDVREENYDAKDLYQTQYVIWSNFPMKRVVKDQHTYELAADVLNRVGIHVGTTFIYHQDRDHDSPAYLSGLETLAYDMLYGQCYIYGGKNPFSRAGMKMGVKDIRVDRVVNVAGRYYLQGENFTEQSKVSLNGRTLKTIYLGPTLLGLNEEVDEEDVKDMKVSQIDKSNETIISTTE